MSIQSASRQQGSQDGSKIIFKCELILAAEQVNSKENTHHAENEIKESSV